MTIYTIGHSTRTIESFTGLLQAHGVQRLMDIRTVPRSRYNPQFNLDSLPDPLRAIGIEHSYDSRLGGLRKPSGSLLNLAWRNVSFRAFADHMQTPEFADGIEALISLAHVERIAIMCCESVPWRCHRSLVSDALVARGISVNHIMSVTSAPAHKLTSFANVQGSVVTYPGEQQCLALETS